MAFDMGMSIPDVAIIQSKKKNLITKPRTGDEENFLVAVKAYTPPFIRCTNTPQGQAPVTAACKTILNYMKASTVNTTFGAVGVEEVDEHLPQVISDRKNSF